MMEPIEYVRGLRRRWRVIAAATLVGAVVAWLTSSALPQTSAVGGGDFEADVLVLDARGTQFDPRGGTQGMSLETMATLVTLEGGDVAERAAERLGGDLEPEELAQHVEASADTESQILTITATRPTAPQAERTALAFAKGLQDYLLDQRRSGIRAQIRAVQRALDQIPEGDGGRNDQHLIERQTLQQQLSGLQQDMVEPLGLPIIEKGEAEEVDSGGISAPSSRGIQLLIGAFIGFLGGIGLALVLERFDRKISGWRQAAEHVDAPLLGEIPKIRRGRSIAVVDSPTSRGADAFRLLASTMLHEIHERAAAAAEGNGHVPPKIPVIAITSAMRSEGKSFISANLAAALAELGMRITVISCDLRAPQLHRYMDVPRSPGIVDAVRSWDGKPGFHRIHLKTRIPNVSLIPSGTSTPRPTSVLTSKEFHSILEYAQAESDIVLLDTPATLLSGDALTALQESECALLVARVGRTPVEALERVSDTIARLGVDVAGVALNGSKGVTAGWHRSPYRISRESDKPAELATTTSEGT
jgi:Mrp family chromosome partitioning ATPase/capsular polysaccharide biosynthesis protein